MQWRAERTFIATLRDRTGVGFLLETLNGREKWSHPPLSHALQRFGSTSTLSNTVRGRNNGACFPSINSSKKFCQDMFHFTLRAWLSLQSEVCVKWHRGRQRGEYAVASHYYKKLFCENSDVRGFLLSSWPLHNFFNWHVFRSIPPLTHHEFGKW